MWLPWMEFAAVLTVATLLTIPMGKWLARCFTSEHHGWLERLSYRAMGVNPQERMGWQRYGAALVLSNAVMMLLGYLLLRLQAGLPLNPLAIAAQSPDLAFNTAASFITNTNWQAYAGENSLSNATQMVVITFLMFAGATTGVAAGAGFVRGLARSSAQDIGNFWVDFVRVFWRVLLPLSFLLALVYVWQGIPQTLHTEAVATTLEGARQQLLVGPVASLESIKHLGTNGGGFFSMNAAHPFENPTPLTNLLHILAMLLIPAGMTYAFGAMLLRRKQGWVLFAACMVMFIGFLSLVFVAEQQGSQLLARAGADQQWSPTQSGGNMEGKELRFGIADTALFVTVTTAATTGSVNAMHDSLTPLGSITPLAQMMLNCVFGGDGVGLINLIQYAILTVFLAGMMIGRTPEFLGKKIEVREIKLVMLAVLVPPACILGFTALAVLWPDAAASLNNRGPHGFSEILYAYASGTANNGSAFAGLNANTPFFNTTIGLAMLAGRFLTLLPMLAVAGSLAAKATVPAGPGTFPTATPLFMGLLVFVVLVVGGLTFLPALALGPVIEHLQMLVGHLYA
ncbi:MULTISPECIES: potassium-transporting ATPase subunit KdpA [Comamonas]|uniref:Potassium-transporting ATPase potassium-binding subunit n=1 Tax=Comamonas terrigena TaxID=32013 RepID=A0A2A7US73_COMTR|nr:MULTISPECIES: potassium-transporting ATPase subunit KdpA [Comamonas]MBD9533386.1 potassium-transporting ATPase subunit KdpA [Comamonas sp. CMM01]PEH88123.1 potassium-transporting ATPase subunit KdpA [Comamonas terrigena]BBL23051.1 potassium-transporting ATPase potassium-binding subunit [Comamonas terrigena NBRC 13299]SUY87179.1 potassium-transporting ATPase subunit A [Comamonas terrigena]